MAQKVEVLLIDDVDGGEANETIGFALDGVRYEIDLSQANAASLRQAIGQFTGCARRVGGKPRQAGRRRRSTGVAAAPPAASATSTDGEVSPKDVRAWAAAKGIKVSDRGRIPASVLDRYNAAH